MDRELQRQAAHEITEPVRLCGHDGNLNPAAVGWSRRPLHDCRLMGHRLRKKRWDYWCITDGTNVFSLTVANLDYLSMVTVMLGRPEADDWIERAWARPLAGGVVQADAADVGQVRVGWAGLRVAIDERQDATRIVIGSRIARLEAELVIDRPKDHDTLNVVVPWSPTQFQFTSKQNTRPARGFVQLGGRRVEFGEDAFGHLDYGRGVWPHRVVWNWGGGSARIAGRTVGLQFGDKWTDGTGQNENGLCIDGHLTKLGDVRFSYDRRDFKRPWHISTVESDRVRLQFTPLSIKRIVVPLGIVGANAHVGFGWYSGRVRGDDGETIELDRFLGWAEEMRARW